MARATEHDIKVLNSLIETTLDSADGYKQAASNAGASQYKSLFAQFADERRQVVTDLQGQVRVLGGTPEDDGSVLAAAHRKFLDLRDHVQKGDEAVINEVERGEDHLKAKYEDALEDEELSPEVRDAVIRAYGSVKAGHDQASELKHSYKRT
jgi:uncharacterized protein (TIGR02284 family)